MCAACCVHVCVTTYGRYNCRQKKKNDFSFIDAMVVFAVNRRKIDVAQHNIARNIGAIKKKNPFFFRHSTILQFHMLKNEGNIYENHKRCNNKLLPFSDLFPFTSAVCRNCHRWACRLSFIFICCTCFTL